MKNETTRFLKISLVFVSVFCIFIFGIQSFCMNLVQSDAIRKLGVIYMSGMSRQVASHFGTTIELRLSQVEELVQSVPPVRYKRGTPLQIELTHNARTAGFEYLAFYTGDGKFHMIYGSEIKADVPKSLQHSIQSGMYNVCAGKDASGTPIALIGIPAAYPMKGSKTSMAIIAGLPISYLADTLENGIKSDMVEYAIIRDDGSYVLSNGEGKESNYFERIKNRYEAYDGKTPEQYAQELADALDDDHDYTSEVKISKERWNVYCTNLPDSEWHLLLKMSHNTMDETIRTLGTKWTFISVGGCSLILAALLAVFGRYFRLTRRQMKELDEARKFADEARRSAERSSKAKSEFLSNISHDIRTPMNGIMGMTSIAIGNLDNPARVRSCLKKINVSSRHLLGLINDMLDMSKIEGGRLTLHMEQVSLREIMQNISTIIRPQMVEKRQNFKFYIHELHTENVCSDRVRLSQILLNILGNAVKFTPEDGTIEVSLHEEPSPKGDAYIRSCLHVKDNGIGMSQEFQEKIFDAFAREDNARVDRTAGAGMGMTITKYIVDAMDGMISVKSEQGKGTEFFVAIDMEKVYPQEPELHLPQRDILVICPDEKTTGILVKMLDSMDLHAQAVPDIEQAVQMAEGRQENCYHMILLDKEAQDQDSIQAARELRSRIGSQMPILLIVEDGDELEAEAEAAGISGYLEKPLFRSNLYYGLRRFAEAEPSKPQQEERLIVDLNGRRALVAEDNELNWEVVDAILSEAGMTLEWAENGKICVEKFMASKTGWYDVILMDLRMPVMSGFEAARAIRSLNRADAATVPIIAVSADAFEDDVRKCFESGMNGHTAKPFDLTKVISLLGRYLH